MRIRGATFFLSSQSFYNMCSYYIFYMTVPLPVNKTQKNGKHFMLEVLLQRKRSTLKEYETFLPCLNSGSGWWVSEKQQITDEQDVVDGLAKHVQSLQTDTANRTVKPLKATLGGGPRHFVA